MDKYLTRPAIKPLSQRLEERLKALDERLKAKAIHYRVCYRCNHYKANEMPYFRDGDKYCRDCMRILWEQKKRANQRGT